MSPHSSRSCIPFDMSPESVNVSPTTSTSILASENYVDGCMETKLSN